MSNVIPAWLNLSYANVATTSPAAHAAAARWAEALARGGAAEFDADAEAGALLPLRRSAARLLNCGPEEVCVGSSATELLCSVAWAVGLERGSNIVSTSASFPSTVYPWVRAADAAGAEVRLASHDEDFYTEPDDIRSLIDDDTAVVTLSHVEYSNGQRYDIESLARAARAVGAWVVVDATQSMGVVPIDAPSLGVDVLVSSGYKWLRGAFGAAVAYMGPRARGLNPGLVGFRSHSEMWDLRAERLNLAEDASRFEYTTMNFGAALGLAEAVDEICELGIETAWEHNCDLTGVLVSGVRSLGFACVSPTSGPERSGIVSLRPPETLKSNEIAGRLQSEHRIVVSSRSGLVRVSPHIDNDHDDIARLVGALTEMVG